MGQVVDNVRCVVEAGRAADSLPVGAQHPLRVGRLAERGRGGDVQPLQLGRDGGSVLGQHGGFQLEERGSESAHDLDGRCAIEPDLGDSE